MECIVGIKNTIQCEDLNDYIELLSKAGNGFVPVAKQCMYEGAKVFADGLRSEINALPGTKSPKNGVTVADKNDLLAGLTVGNHRAVSDGVEVGVTFLGYSDTQKWDPNGEKDATEMKPIPLIARTILKGTTWQKKDDFVGRAYRKNKEKAYKAMDEKCDEIYKKLTNK